ncbi:MAG TPA: non-canonical purine NTP pyrophosphatase [Candidatus Saccharimonadales bacterium]|nr:non-canonical purine NTP pyrophosphatase [Candidatus Saccharimonadales bacterium]
MKKLLIATFNQGKLEDYKSFLKDFPLEFVTLSDLGITEDFDEVFDTFEENAKAKAEFYANMSGLPTLADDSGVEIPYYDMEPGVHTKRWDGIGKNDEHYQKFILEKIKVIPQNQRSAQLRAVLALSLNGETHMSEGVIKGNLTNEVYPHSDTHGYPWDRVFIIPEVSKYYEELSDAENHKYNHRRLALQKLNSIIEKHLL